MAFSVQRLLQLWSDPLPVGAAARAAFAELYTDPVTINGTSTPVERLADAAASLQQTYADVEREVLDIVEAPGQIAVAFLFRGRHVGPLPTPVGTIAPTGALVELRAIDILTLTDERISTIWVVADELGALARLGVVTRAPGGDEASGESAGSSAVDRQRPH
jgi:predicted ester cyclase